MTTEVANLVARLRADASGYVTGIAEAVSADDKLVASHKRTVATAMEVGGALSKYVTLPILAAAAISTKMSIDFDAAFAHVAAAAKLPQAGIDALKGSVLDLARSTAQSPTQLADTLVGIERSGVGAANAVGVLDDAAKLAATGLATQANAADVVTSAMNAYGPAHLSAAHAGDLLTTAAETSKITIDGLSGAMGRALAPAAALGVSFQNLLAAEATMSKEGLSAGQAGMSLFRILSSIVNPTTKGTEAMSAFGLSIGQAQQMIKDGNFIGLLTQIGEHTKGNEQALLQLTGGIRGAAGAFALGANSGKDLRDEQQKLIQSSGSLNDLMGKVAGTTGFQLRQAVTSVEVGLIKWGDAFAPVIKGLAGMVSFIGDAVGAASKMPGPLKDITIAALGTAAAIGPLILIGGSLAKAWLALQELAAQRVAASTANTTADTAATAAAEEQVAAQTNLTASFEAQDVVSTKLAETLGVYSDELITIAGESGAVLQAQHELALVMGEYSAATDVATVSTEELAAAREALIAANGTGVIPEGVAAAGLQSTAGVQLLPETTGIAGLTTVAEDATPAVGGLLAGLGGLAVAAAAVSIPLIGIAMEIHNAGAEARANAADVKTLTTNLSEFNNAPLDKQQRQLDDISTRIQKALAESVSQTPLRLGPTGATAAANNDPSALENAVSAASKGLPDEQKLTNLHKALADIAEQGSALSEKPFFDKMLGQLASSPPKLALFKQMFGDLIANADKAATQVNTAMTNFGAGIGVGPSQATAAVAAYDAAMSSAKNITEDTKTAGEQAAVALAGIGVAAGFAAQATVNGMSTAQIAVAGLAASIQSGLSVQSSYDSVASSIEGIHTAQTTVGGGGGGGGGKTAAAAADDHAQKELAVRDALRAVGNESAQIAAASTQLAQAHLSESSSVVALKSAYDTYEETLHGVVQGALAAKDSTEQLAQAQVKAQEAVLGLQSAQNNKVDAKLNVDDARRQLAQVENDRRLAQFAVQDAQRQLALDQGAASGQTFLQTPHGSIVAPPSSSTDPNQIAKDQIALRDAQIAAGGSADSVTKAQIALSNALIAQKQKTIDLTAATKTTNDTLHGYAAGSIEAQQATDALKNAYVSAQSAVEGVQSASYGLVTAQDNIANSALALQRAEDDLAGKLTAGGGAAGGYASKAQQVAAATHQAEQNVYNYASQVADATGAQKNSVQWADAFVTALNNIRDTLHPSGPLAQYMQLMVALFQQLLHPMPLPSGTSSAIVSVPGPGGGTVNRVGSSGYRRAIGGPVSPGIEYWVGEHGPERFRPTGMGEIVPAGGATSRGGSGAAGIVHVHQTVELTIQALDPSTTADVVVPALRKLSNDVGVISGIRTE